jgi:hypothetical protein
VLGAVREAIQQNQSIGREGSASFLKKRSKRLLSVWRKADAEFRLNEQKFFGSFFQKRTPSLTY